MSTSSSEARPVSNFEITDLVDQTIDDFRVLRRLGQGGMGQVYLAEQQSLRRKVALKVMFSEGSDATGVKRFQAEGEAVARISHPNIVQIYAIGAWRGLHYLALEYVDGCNLREHVDKKGTPDLSLAFNIMRQVAQALNRASEVGIVHRDIKPENILLSREGEVKVADFGLSRCLAPDRDGQNLTQTGVALGTPLYMSPEQIEGKPIDARSDIYSFGVTCYWMLAGEAPFRGQSAFEIAMHHVQSAPPALQKLRPDLPAGLMALIARMMAKCPEDRPQSGRELLKALNDLESQGSRPPAARTGPIWRRRMLTGTGLATIALAGLSGVILGWRSTADSSLEASNIKAVPLPAPTPSPLASDPTARESRLLQAIHDNPDQGKPGFGFRLQLGLFYLDRNRLDDADRFFNQLLNDSHRPYHALGQLGHAIVLSRRDQPEESNRWFMDFVIDKERGLDKFRVWFSQNHPRLLSAVSEAVNRNALACQVKGIPFPPDLEVLRKPQQLPASQDKGR